VVTGGFVTTMWGFRLSARSSLPAFLLSASFALAWSILTSRRSRLSAELAAVERWWLGRWRWLVVGVALMATLTSFAFTTFSATGADASGYLSYASLLGSGQLTRAEPMAALATWADGAATLAPLGWRHGVEPGEQVPTYAVGLPLLLAPWVAIGGDVAAGAFISVTLGLAIVSIAGVGHRLGGPLTAIFACVWLATSPVALLHAMQVMSDVPVTAAWIAAWWLSVAGRHRWAAIATAIAILIRPNLAPLGALPVLHAWIRTRSLRESLLCAIPIGVSVLVVAFLQWRYFGSPLRSGYGTASEIYSLSNVVPNAKLYGGWLLATHGPWLFAAPLVLLARRREWSWLLLFAGLVVFAYLIYAVFETWTYLRFLLPALAIAMLAVSFLLVQALSRLNPAVRVIVAATLLLALAAINVSEARTLGVFRFAARQARGQVVATTLRHLVSPKSVIVSSEHSGTMRHYLGRPILRWDLMPPDALATAVREWRALGYEFWVVLDDWEEPAFRAKFGNATGLSIDFPPAAESAAGVGIRTRAWRQF
jgi:hypothetical protein